MYEKYYNTRTFQLGEDIALAVCELDPRDGAVSKNMDIYNQLIKEIPSVDYHEQKQLYDQKPNT